MAHGMQSCKNMFLFFSTLQFWPTRFFYFFSCQQEEWMREIIYEAEACKTSCSFEEYDISMIDGIRENNVEQ